MSKRNLTQTSDNHEVEAILAPKASGMFYVCLVLLLGALLLGAEPALAADDPAQGDIRDLKVGVPVSDLAREGYVDFVCVEEGRREPGIGGWAEYRGCPPDEAGRREVGFSYDDRRQIWAPVNDNWEGTKIAGHPVLLSIVIDEAGIVQAIKAETDPQSRPYLKKKAFLLAVRVMGRYGRDGWQCRDTPPGQDRAPVGGLFIDRHCEKDLGDRRVLLDTALYRASEQTGQEFTGRTRLEIRNNGG